VPEKTKQNKELQTTGTDGTDNNYDYEERATM